MITLDSLGLCSPLIQVVYLVQECCDHKRLDFHLIFAFLLATDRRATVTHGLVDNSLVRRKESHPVRCAATSNPAALSTPIDPLNGGTEPLGHAFGEIIATCATSHGSFDTQILSKFSKIGSLIQFYFPRGWRMQVPGRKLLQRRV